MSDLNGDLDRPVVVHTQDMDWEPSPSPGVLRKRLHRVGPPESGQVTSVVVYEAGARFTSHPHPEGEEILVLEGVFSDETGDAPAGTHLLNPEGFEHAPYSHEGCTLFVKLRQYAGSERIQTRTPVEAIPWSPSDWQGIEERTLYEDPRYPDVMVLERWSSGAETRRTWPGGAELFVLDGELEDETGRHAAGSWLRFPTGGEHTARSPGGCTLYAKRGGVAGLRDSRD